MFNFVRSRENTSKFATLSFSIPDYYYVISGCFKSHVEIHFKNWQWCNFLRNGNKEMGMCKVQGTIYALFTDLSVMMRRVQSVATTSIMCIVSLQDLSKSTFTRQMKFLLIFNCSPSVFFFVCSLLVEIGWRTGALEKCSRGVVGGFDGWGWDS